MILFFATSLCRQRATSSGLLIQFNELSCSHHFLFFQNGRSIVHYKSSSFAFDLCVRLCVWHQSKKNSDRFFFLSNDSNVSAWKITNTNQSKPLKVSMVARISWSNGRYFSKLMRWKWQKKRSISTQYHPRLWIHSTDISSSLEDALSEKFVIDPSRHRNHG